MLKQICLTEQLVNNKPSSVIKVLTKSGDRIRIHQPIIELQLGSNRLAITAPYNGWVRYVAVKDGQSLQIGQLLFVIDTADDSDYRSDNKEVSPNSELGKDGRRGLERDGQRPFAEHGYAAPLFDAPEYSNGFTQAGIPAHPLMSNMKEGVPPKMSSSTAQNNPAQKKLADEATQDPKLQKQLSNELTQSLNLGQQPSMSITPSTPTPRG